MKYCKYLTLWFIINVFTTTWISWWANEGKQGVTCLIYTHSLTFDQLLDFLALCQRLLQLFYPSFLQKQNTQRSSYDCFNYIKVAARLLFTQWHHTVPSHHWTRPVTPTPSSSSTLLHLKKSTDSASNWIWHQTRVLLSFNHHDKLTKYGLSVLYHLMWTLKTILEWFLKL